MLFDGNKVKMTRQPGKIQFFAHSSSIYIQLWNPSVAGIYTVMKDRRIIKYHASIDKNGSLYIVISLSVTVLFVSLSLYFDIF